MSPLEEAKLLIVNTYSNADLSNFPTKQLEKINEITVIIDTSIENHSEIEGNIIKIKSDFYKPEQKSFLIAHEIMHFIFTHPVHTNVYITQGNLVLNGDIERIIYDVFIDSQMRIFYPDFQNLASSLGKPTGIYQQLGDFQNEILVPFIGANNIDTKIQNIYPLIADFLEIQKGALLARFGVLI